MRSIAQNIAAFCFLFAAFTASTNAQTGQLPTQQDQNQQIEVNDNELERFAQAFQGMRMLNQQVQQEMAQIVEEEGMEIQRFNEIHQATVDPAVEVDVTEDEMEQYKTIATEISVMQERFQGQLEEIVSSQDLTLERYEQIATQLQRDPDLQERLRAVFQD